MLVIMVEQRHHSVARITKHRALGRNQQVSGYRDQPQPPTMLSPWTRKNSGCLEEHEPHRRLCCGRDDLIRGVKCLSPNGQSDKTSGDSVCGKETETQINQLGSLSGDHRRAGCPNTDPRVEGAREVDPNPEGLRAKPVSGSIYLHLVT